MNFFEFIAEEVRELLAELGFRTLEEAIGHAEVLDVDRGGRPLEGGRARPPPILHVPELPEGAALHQHRRPRTTASTGRSTRRSSSCATRRSSDGTPVTLELPIRNVNRTVGTMLGAELTRRYGGAGLPDDTIVVNFTGSAGQSFGAFVPRGITLRLEGDANDYVGKGLSGGRIIVRPPERLRRSSPRRTSSPATSSSTAPPAARCSSGASSASGSACATPAPSPSSRASATTAAST